MDWNLIAIAAFQLFIITDPIGNLPIFFALTKRESNHKRREVFLTAVIAAFILLLLFTLAGGWILLLFHISMSDFKIAGGGLLFVISILLLVRGSWFESNNEESTRSGVVPLACPILVGPGAITTAMVQVGIFGINITLIAIFINFFVSFIILYFGNHILRIIGDVGAEIMSRILLILIAAMGVNFVRQGILEIIVNNFK
jgi:multiple antibiotic resistance protein